MNDKIKALIVAVAATVAIFGVGAAFGRFTVAEKVVEREVVKTVEVEKQVVVERVDEKQLEVLSLQIKDTLNQLSQLKKRVRREKRSVQHPDGRIETVETVDINVDRTVQTTEVKEVEKRVVVEVEKIVDRIVEVEKEKVVEVEKEKIVEASKPSWRAGALLGTTLSVRPQLTPPYIDPLLVGGHVERRIVGPVFIGGWGITDTKLQNPGFGASLSIEW